MRANGGLVRVHYSVCIITAAPHDPVFIVPPPWRTNRYSACDFLTQKASDKTFL
uniref:Uncharacterized protein n=1 Tax=Anguilla anguilla TaxID=7936 RepID=A0A0E9XNZ8_ANGAN